MSNDSNSDVPELNFKRLTPISKLHRSTLNLFIISNDSDSNVSELSFKSPGSRMLDLKGKTLRKLNKLVGQMSKFEPQYITNVYANIVIIEYYRPLD